MSELIPPSSELLPPTPALRKRLAIAIREVHLLRRLIRVAESVRNNTVKSVDQFSAPSATMTKEAGRA